MAYGAEYNDRVEQYGRRNRGDVVIALSEVNLACVRLGEKDEKLKKLAESLERADIDIFPGGLFVKGKNGETMVNLSAAFRGSVAEQVNAVPHGRELFLNLQKDATLLGKETIYTRNFRESRRRTGRKNADLSRAFLIKSIDHDYGLATDGKMSHLESAEDKESFKEIETFLQNIVDKLFAASGLKKFKPKVYLTKSAEVNAFVLTQDTGTTAHDYLQSASDKQPLELPVFIHRGLLDELHSEDEVAGVLSHEFAHLLQPDYLSSADQSLQKRLEYDADTEGLRLADAAGFNPRGLIDVLKSFPKGSDKLKLIFGSSHPDTDQRIIELEKLFHRGEIPLPNAAKKMKPYPEFIARALEQTQKNIGLNLISSNIDVYHLETGGKLEETLKQVDGLVEYFKYNDGMAAVANKRLESHFRDYELATGAFGHRDKLLARLNIFQALLLKFKEDKDTNIRIPRLYLTKEMEMPTDAKLDFVGADKLADLKVTEKDMAKFRKGIEEVQKQYGLDSANLEYGLEDWLRDDPPEGIALFWQNVNPGLTRGYKIFILYNWLQRSEPRSPFFTFNERSDFEITTSEEVITKTPKSVKVEDKNILDNVPLALRAHRKKSGEGLKAEVEFEEKKELKPKKIFDFFLDRVEVDHNLWNKVDKNCPEAVKDLSGIIQKQAAEAYQNFLKESGFGDLPKEMAEFILRYLIGERSSSFSYLPSILAQALDHSIKFFDQVYQALSFLNFDKLNKDISGFESRAHFIKDQFFYFIVFLLKPKNKEEEEIRSNYLKRLGLDTTALGHKTELDEKVLPEGIDFNRKFFKPDKDDPNKVKLKMSPTEARMFAAQELIFSEFGTQGDRFIFDDNAEAMPPWAAITDLKKMPYSLAEYLNQGSLNKLEKAKDKIIGRDKVFSGVEGEMGRCVNVLLGLIDKIKKEDLLDLNQIKSFVDQQAGIAIASDHSYVRPYGYNEVAKIDFLSDFIGRYAQIFADELSKKGIKSENNLKAVEKYLWQFLGIQFSYQDILATNIEFQAAGQDKKGGIPTRSLERTAEHTKGSLAWSLYKRKDVPVSVGIVRLNKVEVFVYLDELARQNKDALNLKELIIKISKSQKDIPQAYLMLATGHLTEFQSFLKSDKLYSNSTLEGVDIKDVIKCLRLAEKMYGSEWKTLEQYRRFDEQMSVWEWTLTNPLIKDLITERHGKKDTKIPLVEYIQNVVNSSLLTGLYEMDTNFLDGPRFSWPLFLNDLWEGNNDFIDELESKFYSDRDDKTNKDKNKKKIEALHLFKKRLHEIVNNPNNLKDVFAMQPGFFKEFILNKKMEAQGVKSLEEIEGYMDHFTAYTHEGSKRNQLPGLIENIRSDARQKRKRELFIQVINEIIESEDRRQALIASADGVDVDGFNNLSDRDVDVNIFDYADLSKQESALASKLMRARLVQEELAAPSRDKIAEADLSLYSDHVVENDRSKLEIGPVYRLRWLAQPLMDWHVQALDKVGSATEAKVLFDRVAKDLPEKHPLRDLFVKNQLAVEIWQILKKVLKDPQTAGFNLVRKDIDIGQALKNFPLNAEHSFLKSYGIFEVEGLMENIQKLSPQASQSIIETLEDVVNNRISPDQQAAVRRLLFSFEQKTKFDGLKQARKNNPQVFEDYLQRLLAYYPDPSLERDDILEQSVMELAQTPEQIRQVWSLRYQEQTRWANEDESAIQKSGFEAAERARLGIASMDTLDRSQYLLWMLGGKTPLSELFTAQDTGISLEERKNTLWKMTKAERRSLLYELLMGEKGLLVPKKFAPEEDTLSDEELKILEAARVADRVKSGANPDDLTDLPPRWERSSDMIRYVVDNIFEQTFGDQALDPNLPTDDATNKRGRELMRTVFHELFLQQKDSARRTELMINIVEAVGKNKYEGKSLTPGELMKLLLEQVGVVGMKVGQVLSEQPGLLPDSLQKELSTLKDQAATFSKRGVLTYLEAAGWVSGEDPKITSIADCIGSASIKQVMEGKTKAGETVAIKVKRPSIDKNFAEDMELLKAVLVKVKEKGFDVPGYLIDEVRDIVLEELSFTHESDNQLAMKRSLQARKAAIPIEVGGVVQEISLSVSAPLSVSEVLYPTDAQTEDIGLMVEEFVRGLSLKNLQEYQTALIKQDNPKIEKMRQRVGELYGQSRIEKVEKQVKGMSIDNLQAQLAIDLLRQITKDGVFHADLHGGNFYLDFNPAVKDGVFSEMQGVFIDLGSVGFSKSEVMPQYQKEVAGADFNASGDFRDFITALFSIDLMPEGAKQKIAEMVNHYAGLNWDEARVDRIFSQSSETESRVKGLFYAILEQKGQGQLNPQFRALLKTLATAAGHFDKLKTILLGENPESLGISPEEMSELVNFDAIAAI